MPKETDIQLNNYSKFLNFNRPSNYLEPIILCYAFCGRKK